MNELLAQHIRRAAREPFQWGTLDCWMFVGDWVLLCTGCDPAASMRGRYSTKAGCLRAILRAGERDYGAIAARCAASIALEPIESAQARVGDVAALASLDGHVGAIRAATGWIGKGGSGLWYVREASAHVAAAWRVCHA